MSSDVVIRAEGLGKKYIIGHQAERERYTTLRDSVGRSLKNWGRSARDMFAGKALVAGDETEEFWALKDINFEIKRGDVVGIIGRNGAGKSTLLKVLSRITEPTTGRVTIDGRVASLLEVGTGFHPELSGRENIYLNGAILGMSREEIRRKFDEIVDFAGVEKFLDTPVKRYSSGMYVRLAFAVAAHLEPEILIVDEVLAVGDAEFQKKCLGKMKDVAGHGRTVLFVSHNMGAVLELCNTAITLRSGTTTGTGGVRAQVSDHLNNRVQAQITRRDLPVSCIYSPASRELIVDLYLDRADEEWGVTSAIAIIINGQMQDRLAVIELKSTLEKNETINGQDLIRFKIVMDQLLSGHYIVDLFVEGTIFAGDIGGLHSFEIEDSKLLPFERRHMGILHLPSTVQLNENKAAQS
jgi:ABC-type polysaccharide/polyol phosphate transport system ATPase subunit